MDNFSKFFKNGKLPVCLRTGTGTRTYIIDSEQSLLHTYFGSLQNGNYLVWSSLSCQRTITP